MGNGLDLTHFEAVEREIDGRKRFHIHLKVKRPPHIENGTLGAFWGLFVYEDDDQISKYDLTESPTAKWPAGWIPGVWVPTPIRNWTERLKPHNVALWDVPDGPIGNNEGGGP